jgi:putative ABC transport system ATP-binding protein
MDILLKAEHISKDYITGEVTVHALRDVSFDLYRNELVVILGPSGSGKSTLLNILGGIETITSGNVTYEDHSLAGADRDALTAYRRDHVGYVFQFYNLLPGLTALENIELAGELSKDPLDARTLLEQVGLGDRADHFPGKLSGGQQQRIAIARALCKNPDLLLCDEPTGALDSQSGLLVLEAIYDFYKKYGKTVVLITHNRDISQMADRVFSFKDGMLVDVCVNETPLRPSEITW